MKSPDSLGPRVTQAVRLFLGDADPQADAVKKHGLIDPDLETWLGNSVQLNPTPCLQI